MSRKFIGFRVDADLYDRFKGLLESKEKRVSEEFERFIRTCVEASTLNVLVGSAIGEKLWFESRVEREMRWLKTYVDAKYVPGFEVHDPAEELEALLPRVRDEATARNAIELLKRYYDMLLQQTMKELKKTDEESDSNGE